MKIAIAANGKDEEAMISDRAARAPYFLVFEGKNLVEVIKNPFAIGSGGAGFSAAYMLADKGVEKFVAVKIGPNMKRTLQERGIDYEEMEAKVLDAIGE